MNETRREVRAYRFGIYELDLNARELRKRGLRVKLQEKPFQILELLLERAGQVVTRKDLRQKLWPDTFVGFDRSLNTAVNSLRRALGDSSGNPRFVETRSRQGYRLVVPREAVALSADNTGENYAFDSIAVLPFHNGAADSEMDYLSEGITESIINTLSRLAEIRVMAHSTVFRYRGKEIDPQAVGQDLNVRVLLTGKVRKRGDALQISVELVDTLRGWRLWGEEYNREWQGILDVQQEIASEISEKLRLRLTTDERKELRKRHTANSEAYRVYLRGRYHLNRVTEDGLEKSVAFFEQALHEDREFALPYAGLADAYSLFAYFGIRPARDVMPLAEVAARRALELDSRLPEAHASLAGVLKSYHWDWEGAAAAYRQALALNPNYATGHRFYADFLCAQGKMDESAREMDRALELDPFSLVIHTENAWNSYMARNGPRAADQALKTLEMEPQFAPAFHVLGLAYEQMGKFKEAIEAFQKAAETSGENPISLASVAHALAGANRKAEARKILAGLKREAKQKYLPPYVNAVVHLGLGEKAEGLRWLETAYKERDVWLVWILQDPRLDAVRNEPRVQTILEGMNLGKAGKHEH